MENLNIVGRNEREEHSDGSSTTDRKVSEKQNVSMLSSSRVSLSG